MVEISLSGSGEGPGRVTSRPTLQRYFCSGVCGNAPPAPHRLDAASPLYTAACACRSARWRGLGCVSKLLRGRGPGNGQWWQAREGRWHTGVRSLCTPVTDGTTPRVVGLVESVCLRATT